MKATLKFLALGLISIALVACTTNTKGGKKAGEDVEDVSADAATTVSVDNDRSVREREAELERENLAVQACLSSVLYFEFDKSSLTAETRRDLDACAEALRASPRSIRLEGHADERGTREYNIALGERRAKSVADYLIGSGVSAGRVETISYGEERPAVAGSDSSAWQKNRRVELR